MPYRPVQLAMLAARCRIVSMQLVEATNRCVELGCRDISTELLEAHLKLEHARQELLVLADPQSPARRPQCETLPF